MQRLPQRWWVYLQCQIQISHQPREETFHSEESYICPLLPHTWLTDQIMKKLPPPRRPDFLLSRHLSTCYKHSEQFLLQLYSQFIKFLSYLFLFFFFFLSFLLSSSSDLPHMCSFAWRRPQSCDGRLRCSSHTWTQSTKRFNILSLLLTFWVCVCARRTLYTKKGYSNKHSAVSMKWFCFTWEHQINV